MEPKAKGETIVRNFMIENTHIKIFDDDCRPREEAEEILKHMARQALEAFGSIPRGNNKKPAP